MTAAYFYFLAIAMFGLGVLLVRHTSRYSHIGGTAYERQAKRRRLGEMLMIAGAVALGIALLHQAVPYDDALPAGIFHA